MTSKNPRNAGRKPVSPSGEVKVNTTVSLCPELKKWAKANKIGLSETLTKALEEKKNKMTTKYKLITGPFAGEVVREGTRLLGSFQSLDEDMQSRVREFGEDYYKLDPQSDFPVSMDSLTEQCESSWESIETDEPVTLGN